MSSIRITGNGNKSHIKEDFPTCEVKKSWLFGYKWKVKLGGATSEGSIDSLTDSFIQNFNGVTISGNKSKYNDSYLIVVTYKERSKIFVIQGGEVTEQ